MNTGPTRDRHGTDAGPTRARRGPDAGPNKKYFLSDTKF